MCELVVEGVEVGDAAAEADDGGVAAEHDAGGAEEVDGGLNPRGDVFGLPLHSEDAFECGDFDAEVFVLADAMELSAPEVEAGFAQVERPAEDGEREVDVGVEIEEGRET